MVRAALVLLTLTACGPDGSDGSRDPRVLQLEVGPGFATVSTVFEAKATGYDPLGGVVVVDLVWEVDGKVVQRGGTTLEAPFRKGSTVQVVGVPSVDDREGEPFRSAPIVVQNSAPDITGVFIDPPVARAWLTDLVCGAFDEPFDADGDAISWTFLWTVDGVPVTEGLGSTHHVGDTVPAAMLRDGQVWRCRAELTDGEDVVAPTLATRTVQLGVAPLRGVPAAGGSFTCVIDAEDHARCWGEDGNARLSTAPSSETFAYVYAGNQVACGLRPTDLGLTCWGDERTGLLSPPSGPWLDVALGSDVACGIRGDGTLTCWGEVGDPRMASPPGTYRDVAIGDVTACAINSSGRPVCWGDTSRLAAGPPEDTLFAQVAVGWDHVCGITTQAKLACWGGNTQGQSRPPEGRYLAVAAGPYETCALDDDGDIVCFGESDLRAEVEGTSLSMSFGQHVCARTQAGSIACLNTVDELGRLGAYGQDVPPVDPWISLSVGDGVTCGLTTSERASCFGPYGAIGMPTERLDLVAAGSDAACGVAASDGRALCWGLVAGTGLDEIPDVPLVDLAVGAGLACGLDAAGQPHCWGDNANPPPAGPFQSIHVADIVACGHRLDDTITCWNANGPRVWAPTGAFTSMDLDGLHGCGLRPDRSVSCWGSGTLPPDDPGPFVDVAVATSNACGIDRSGAATCWGRMYMGSLEPPPVRDFVAIEGGSDLQCGRDASGGVWCWGLTGRRPVDLP